MLCCSYCGQHYPNSYSACTCRVCGGSIESSTITNVRLSARRYIVNEVWHDWRAKMLSAPPRPCKESDWFEACAHFNGCAFCGVPTIDNQHLFVGTKYGGKYYSYNVVPICDQCEKAVGYSTAPNPFAAYMNLHMMDEHKLDSILSYLETKMLGVVFEEFDFEHDSIDIICRCTEDTDNLPFDGIRARRRFDYPNTIDIVTASWLKNNMVLRTAEEIQGITWRLLDDEGYEELVSSNRRSNA